MDEAKPFKIPKREVWEAFKRVKVNGAIRDKGKGDRECDPKLGGSASSKRSASNEPPVLSFIIRGVQAAALSPAVKDARATLGLLDEGEGRVQHSSG